MSGNTAKTTTVLTVDKISFAHPGQETIIKDLSFELTGGEILGLVGQNGAGKSTLLDLLAGIREPALGRISLSELTEAKPNGAENKTVAGNQNILRGDLKEDSKALRKRVALLPQNVDYYLLGESPREDLGLALGEVPEPTKSDKLLSLAGHWGLEKILEKPIETLSMGQKKRLALASSMATEPKVLLLDEPFSGLDWPGCLNILGEMKKLPEKKLILVLATHEPGLIADLVHKWLLMKPGQHLLASPEQAFRSFAEFGVRPI
jgi:biotin transport system ATP-binding protein